MAKVATYPQVLCPMAGSTINWKVEVNHKMVKVVDACERKSDGSVGEGSKYKDRCPEVRTPKIMVRDKGANTTPDCPSC